MESFMTTDAISRRAFLVAGSLVTAGLSAKAEPAPLLPTIKLGKYDVTRLILGSNPFNGFCYSIPSLSQHMREWSTPERIAGVLNRAQECGINTWQFSYYDSSLEGLRLHRAAGGSIQWLLVTGGAMQEDPGLVRKAAALGPMGIIHHGGVTDRMFRTGRPDKVRDYLKAIRDSGVMVGVASHNPAVILQVEEGGWDVDFYMTCFYQITRTEDEIRKITTELPLGDVFLEGDPGRMCSVIRQTRKPCLGFKILAAGRKATSPEALEAAFRWTYDNIKPTDAVITGMYPRFKDELSENATMVRRIGVGPR
jgi:hypothetical protein